MSDTREEPMAALEAAEVFRLLVDSVRDYAIFVLDAKGRVRSWNAGAERLKGYSQDEILGRHYRTFYPEPVKREGQPERQLEIAAREGRFEGEGWRIRKDGTRFWAHVVITPLHKDGRLIGFGKVTGDMTSEYQARQELLQRERQLAEAHQIAHLGSWEWDLRTDQVRWSDELFRIFGLEVADSLSLEEYRSLLDPEDREEVDRKVRAVLEHGGSFVHEHLIRRPDGRERWVQSRGEVVKDEGGEPVRMVGTTLDITDLKRAEARTRRLATERAAREEAERTAQRMGFLAEASALLSGSLQYSETLRTVAWLAVPSFADWCMVDMVRPDGTLDRLAVAHMDPDRVTQAWELHGEYPSRIDEATGPGQAVVTGEPELIEEFTDDLLEASARDDRQLKMLREMEFRSAITAPIQVRARTLGALTFVSSESDRRYGQEDLVVAQELASRAGLAIENAQLHAAEREARERAERATERTARLQAITAGLSEAVTPDAVAEVIVGEGVAALEADTGALVLARSDGTLELVRSVGLPDAAAERYLDSHVPAADPLARAIETEEIVVLPNPGDPDAPSPGHLGGAAAAGLETLVGVPLRSAGGVLGALAFGYFEPREFAEDDRRFLEALGRQCAQAMDRARLYETEHAAREAAEEASLAKSQFVAMMSHELRTPLAAIIGYQELLSEEISGPVTQEQRQQLERIRSSAAHLRDLINQILSLSRIEAGKEEVQQEDTDLVALVREVSILMQQEIEKAGLDLEVSLPDDPIRLETDPGKVRQILLNLISNAVKFTEEGSVRVRVSLNGRRAAVAVEDTGIGIDPKDRDQIFDAFTQVDQSMTRQAGGSGLGLPVSRRLARLLGGRIELESEPGRGSTFTLRLPL